MHKMKTVLLVGLLLCALNLATAQNTTEPDGTTALHKAVRADDVDLATRLLRSGAKVTGTTRYGVTPLYLACVNGNAAMIDALLRAGADANSAKKRYWKCLADKGDVYTARRPPPP